VSDRRHKIRQQTIQEAEGYLDLVLALGDGWQPKRANAARLAERALATLDRLDEIGAERPSALYLRGQALRFLGRHREAVDPLSEAAEIDPENVHVYLALGWCYKRMGRIDQAIEALEEALEVAPDEGLIHFNLACYWSLAGSVEHAVGYLAQAFTIDPHYRNRVPDEPDFDPIRHHNDFQALTAVIV